MAGKLRWQIAPPVTRMIISVPLLPPPDGEKFAGGYQIQVQREGGREGGSEAHPNLCLLQRNPITGGARLLPPAGS